ncbi:hypothetical protein LCGC14_1068830 [marine sediment metagenome]|uniref:Uncharacterized protein n=2 Tax=root TaxID=1 RepID=A0A831QM80_9FLAO|nr:hypothetical protein [Pricia sp.]HEA19482.1 hypothetical protein [Pricia antarctica]
MTALFLIIGLLLLVLLLSKLNVLIQFRRQVKTLFAQSKKIKGQYFQLTQLINLPEPVQRYFKHILKEGQPYISYVRMKHDGLFKMGVGKSWMNIKGEQYATIAKPGFIWKGTTLMFVARDMYISDKGRLIATLLSVYNVVDAKGKKYNEGELLRWLGESILYPTNFLPSRRLQWLPIDSKSAKLTFQYAGLSLYFICSFNEIGELTEMQTKRYMDEDHLEIWVIKATNYQELNRIRVPTEFDVLWRLEQGDFSYAKFNITEIEYDQPKIFYTVQTKPAKTVGSSIRINW